MIGLRSLLLNNAIFRKGSLPLVNLIKAHRKRVYKNINIIESNILIHHLVVNSIPSAIGKIGSIELRGLNRYLRRSSHYAFFSKGYTKYELHSLFANAGVFPASSEVYDCFAEDLISSVRHLDSVVAWFNPGEVHVFKEFCPNATYITMRSLEPYFYTPPWSSALKGKKVLIIHPFADSIESQYKQRDMIWLDRTVLPDFELLTIKPPLSPAVKEPSHHSWQRALQFLKKQMDEVEYEVCLVGAGAYSLPLIVHAKKRGSIGLHLGGATQILFGIKGLRWDNHPDFKRFYNPYWVRPAPAETPKSKNVVEGGCYW